MEIFAVRKLLSKVEMDAAYHGHVWMEETFTEDGKIIDKFGRKVNLEISPTKNFLTGRTSVKTYRPEHVGVLTKYDYTYGIKFSRAISCAFNADVKS